MNVPVFRNSRISAVQIHFLQSFVTFILQILFFNMQEEFLNFKEKQYTKLESPDKVQHYEDNKIYTMFVRSKGSYVKVLTLILCL